MQRRERKPHEKQKTKNERLNKYVYKKKKKKIASNSKHSRQQVTIYLKQILPANFLSPPDMRIDTGACMHFICI